LLIKSSLDFKLNLHVLKNMYKDNTNIKKYKW